MTETDRLMADCLDRIAALIRSHDPASAAVFTQQAEDIRDIKAYRDRLRQPKQLELRMKVA